MRARVFVQGLHVVPSPVAGVGRTVAVTFGFTDPEAAEKAGFAPQTAITATVLDASGYLPGSEHDIEI